VTEPDLTAPWGMRGWICGTCRTALAPGTTCGRIEWHGDPIAVRPPDGRSILAGRIYGYPPASPWRALARGNLDRAARRAQRWLRQRFGRARGGLAPGRALGPPTGRFGTIRAIDAAPPPWGGAPCVAWALELRLLDGRPATMLRDAACLELAIDLDDGARVRVPAGAIVIGPEVAELEDPDPAAFARYLDWLGVAPAPGLRDVVPHHEVWTVRLHAGDRVEVRGALVEDVRGAAYRDPTGLRPDDVIRVVLAGRR
jgi:hypothetical protein